MSRGETKWGGFSLIEMLIVLAIVSTIVALALPSSDSQVRDQLDAAGRVIVSELEYARELAVSNNSQYRVTFDFAGHRFVLEHAGADATLDALPPSPFRSPQDPPDQHIVALNRLAGIRVPIRLLTAYASASPIQGVHDVEFGRLGETNRADPTVIWLEAGAGSALRYLSLEINPVTGVASVGSLQATAPPHPAVVVAGVASQRNFRVPEVERSEPPTVICRGLPALDHQPPNPKERGRNNFGISFVATVARPWRMAGPPSGDGSYVCGNCSPRVPNPWL